MRRFLSLIGLLCAACQGYGDVPECGSVPAGGCPVAGGGSCSDKACDSVHQCTSEGWVVVKVCERDAGTEDVEAGPEAPICSDSSPNLGDLSNDCDPGDLQLPDCAISVALGCPETACLSGCVDFFLCRDGWQMVAYCDDVTGALLWVDAF